MFENNSILVIEETKEFLTDLFNSKKRLKLFSTFAVSNVEHKGKEIEIEIPKRKFNPKVTQVNLKNNNSHNNKNIF